MKWFKSLVSASLIPDDAAMRRVRKSRVGLTIGSVLTVVCKRGYVSSSIDPLVVIIIFHLGSKKREREKATPRPCGHAVTMMLKVPVLPQIT